MSKWLKYQALIDTDEMQTLLDALKPLYIAVGSEPVTEVEALLPCEEFLSVYEAYCSALKRGVVLEEKRQRRTFSSMFTERLDALFAMPIGRERYLVKPSRPVIQLQMHQFFYSSLDGKFHPMVLGKESVSWGIQFSYPQLCQDPVTKGISKVDLRPEFPNTALFARLTRWMRDHTVPTPFVVEGKRTNVPIRLGKGCFSWIHHHPQLKTKGIEVMHADRSHCDRG